MVWGLYQLMKGSRQTLHEYTVRAELTMQQRCWFHAFNSKLCIFLKWQFLHTLPTLPNWHLPPPIFPPHPTPHSHPPPQPVLLAKMPAPSCLTLGFLAFSWRWSNPSEQYWTSHSIQTSFFYFYFFFFKNLLPVIQFLFFPFCCACILCTLDLLEIEGMTESEQVDLDKKSIYIQQNNVLKL